MKTIAPFAIWLVSVGVIAVIAALWLRYINHGPGMIDGFEDASDLELKACPKGTIQFTATNGDKECCDGEVVDNTCKKTVTCTFAAKPEGGKKSCSTWLQEEWKKRSNEFCPKEYPNYFGNHDKSGDAGCTAGRVKTDGMAPAESTAKKCWIYSTSDKEYEKLDSCKNLKALDELKCPTTSHKKELVETPGKSDLPVLLACAYVDKDAKSPIPVRCYDKERAKLYLQKLYGGEWEAKLKEKGLTLETAMTIC
jgi:hypothetical protein